MGAECERKRKTGGVPNEFSEINLGITKFEHKRNEEIRGETGQCTIAELVTRARLRWLGHVARMGEQRLPPQLLYGMIEGKGRKGKAHLVVAYTRVE